MGKPRMILLIRHAQSEGNKNRDIHQYIPDHRVKLTADGWQQAEEAGRRLRALLRPDDTLQFFTSPYRRTRETTEGILKTLTSDDDEQGPSPFPVHKVKVYEEPRLREQDFGNFQPCSAAMERMWQERADYGHFFYRIPDGESAADAYDRVSGFNESLWRQFSEPDFPSVCVLVTHGLMTRIFLMKWYHWSVEYFEDLRNINHCEFIIMKQNLDNGKYVLQNELRTWSNYKRQEAAILASQGKGLPNAAPPSRRWGGCAQGCNHAHFDIPHRVRRQDTHDLLQLARTAATPNADEDHPTASHGDPNSATSASWKKSPTKSSSSAHVTKKTSNDLLSGPLKEAEDASGNANISDEAARDGGEDTTSSDEETEKGLFLPAGKSKGTPQGVVRNRLLQSVRESIRHGTAGTVDVSDESDYFDTNIHQLPSRMSRSEASRSALAYIDERGGSSERRSSGKSAERNRTGSAGKSGSRIRRTGSAGSMTKKEKEWEEESGMLAGKRADALGDANDGEGEEIMLDEVDVKRLKEQERSSLSEIY
ncbi:phosphoglycerate mutase-like protein [Trichodelitschia bisporula]|uniref:Phosphoglycerate mutase-like protein n=1 Tax=Trichodelitschia bisporula TaxID=703511 RepID=A0A6G1HU71_9PEZI|nr:phosphoglycerate mutase-like protein [Trichodelitschia bisporula]